MYHGILATQVALLAMRRQKARLNFSLARLWSYNVYTHTLLQTKQPLTQIYPYSLIFSYFYLWLSENNCAMFSQQHYYCWSGTRELWAMNKQVCSHLEFYYRTVYSKKGLTIFVAWLSKGLSFRKDNCHYEVLKTGYKKQSCVFIIFNVMFIMKSLIPTTCRAGVCGIQYITCTTT